MKPKKDALPLDTQVALGHTTRNAWTVDWEGEALLETPRVTLAMERLTRRIVGFSIALGAKGGFFQGQPGVCQEAKGWTP